jgi:acetyl-CoA carboxylase beta subunit
VPGLTVQPGAATFSGATARDRLVAALDAPPDTLHCAGRILTATGYAGRRPVCVAASDATAAHGALGTGEADALIALFEQAAAQRIPLLLLLDSAGANVEQGLAALGAFRHLFRAALHARLTGVPMLAVLGRSCFGGASMLACLCHGRSFLAQTRLSTSGPAIIQAADAAAAPDRASVNTVIGSAARLALHPHDALREDRLAAVRDTVAAWLASDPPALDLEADHASLQHRLQQAGAFRLPAANPDPTLHARLSALLPRGYAPALQGHLFCALPPGSSRRAVFLGALGGEPIGAADCWRLADWVLQAGRTHAGSPVVLVLDARGHAARMLDERLLLSDYLVHLSLSIARLQRAGQRCVLWLPGEASGASYVAFAAAVERVSALPSARIAVLPGHAVRTILRTDALAPAQDWLQTGVADAFLDGRVAAYRRGDVS